MAAVCLTVLPCGAASAQPNAGGNTGVGSIAIQLLDAPVNLRHDPRAMTYIVDHLAPGTVIHRRVRVTNRSHSRQHIQVYPAAAAVNDDQFRFAAGGTPNELTSWISTNHSTLDLQPGQAAAVTVTIRVPKLASSGERYAVIWAAIASASDTNANVTVVRRVGVRVYLDIGPGGEPKSDFAIANCTTSRGPTGQPLLTITVRNTGARALDMVGELSLSGGPAGTRAGPFPVTTGVTLAPGETGTVQVPLPADLPNGPWQAHASLASGTVEHTANATIVFPAPGTTRTAAFHTQTAGNRMTVTILVVAGLTTMTGLTLLIRRRRRNRANENVRA